MLESNSCKLAAYRLEGDGPIVFQCYEIISALSTSIVMENYPNVQEILLKVLSSN